MPPHERPHEGGRGWTNFPALAVQLQHLQKKHFQGPCDCDAFKSMFHNVVERTFILSLIVSKKISNLF